jgi:tetratricopeptide (TPR) repeat protein
MTSRQTHKDAVSPAVANLLVTCLVRAGQMEAANALLEDGSLGTDSAGLRYELGMAQLRAGRLESALGQFEQLLAVRPDDPTARQACISVLRAQAGQAALQQRWDAAAVALKRALAFKPGDGDLQGCLDAVQAALPALHLARGERAKAIGIWEAAQRARPGDIAPAHELAILCQRWAIEMERAGDAEHADPLWRQAIGNWALVMCGDEYWRQWQAAREGVYGTRLEAATMDELRATTTPEHLEAIHRDYEQAYLEARDAKNAARHREYLLLLKLELRTARALKASVKALAAAHSSIDCPILAGPIMLARLGALDKAQQVAAAVQRLPGAPAEARDLGLYLSSLGRVVLLLEEHRAEEAQAEMGTILGREPNNAAARHLMARVHLQLGQERSAQNFSGAITLWLAGLDYDPGNEEIKGKIVDASRQEFNAEHLDTAGNALTQLLKRDAGCIPARRLLAQVHHRRGYLLFQQGKLAQTYAELQLALENDPGNTQYLQDKAVCGNAYGVQLFNEFQNLLTSGSRYQAIERLDKAVLVLRDAVSLDSQEESYRQNLAVALRAQQQMHQLR